MKGPDSRPSMPPSNPLIGWWQHCQLLQTEHSRLTIVSSGDDHIFLQILNYGKILKLKSGKVGWNKNPRYHKIVNTLVVCHILKVSFSNFCQ
uniref:Uncharacterized protein n=1 Tax=Meloidogyne enterolobii TaxID=390850 RepID=A0A6V7VP94_MELEN|nr:unnamed protein product [Meloidogyne enterolobii]